MLTQEEVTFDDLLLLSEGDLAKLVPKLGPRRRLWSALHPASAMPAALDSNRVFEFSKFDLSSVAAGSSTPSPTEAAAVATRSPSPSQHVDRPHTVVTYSVQRSNAAKSMQEQLLALQQHKHLQLQEQYHLQVQKESALRRQQQYQSIQAHYKATSPSASTSSSPVPSVITSSTSVASPVAMSSSPPANVSHLTIYTRSPTAQPSAFNVSPTTSELHQEAARQAVVRPYSASDAFGTLRMAFCRRACLYLPLFGWKGSVCVCEGGGGVLSTRHPVSTLVWMACSSQLETITVLCDTDCAAMS